MHYYANVSTDIPRRQWQNGGRPDAPQWKKDAWNGIFDEWHRLRGRETWVIDNVKGFHEINSWAKANNVHVYFGTLHDVCVEKYSELPPDEKKYAGWVVFGGHDIRNEAGLQVLFDDGGSGASFLSASKLLDAVAMLPGNTGEQADAPMAYTQCELGAETEGPTTQIWVEFPQCMWPTEWIKNGYQRPTVPLKPALYGHPMAGIYWER